MQVFLIPSSNCKIYDDFKNDKDSIASHQSMSCYDELTPSWKQLHQQCLRIIYVPMAIYCHKITLHLMWTNNWSLLQLWSDEWHISMKYDMHAWSSWQRAIMSAVAQRWNLLKVPTRDIHPYIQAAIQADKTEAGKLMWAFYPLKMLDYNPHLTWQTCSSSP